MQGRWVQASTHKVDISLRFAQYQEMGDPKRPSHCHTILQRIFLLYLQAGGNEWLHDPL